MKPLIRQKLNIVIDIIMFMVMVALAVIGFFIRYSLLSGEKRWEKFGQNLNMTFWGMDRHEWGFIHLILGISLAALLVLHIFLHWTQIVCMVKKLFPVQMIRVMVVSGLAVLCCAILLTPFVFKPDLGEPIRGQGEGRGRKVTLTIDQSPEIKETEEISFKPEKDIDADNQSVVPGVVDHDQESRVLDIRGYHTLAGLSSQYNVPVEQMKSKLNIPENISDNERLGRIRRIYGFTMREVEDCILSLQKSQ
jgi:hypothetical protein